MLQERCIGHNLIQVLQKLADDKTLSASDRFSIVHKLYEDIYDNWFLREKLITLDELEKITDTKRNICSELAEQIAEGK